MKHILARRIAAGVLCMGLVVSFTPSARRIAAVPGHIIVPAGRADALSGVTGEPTGSAAVLASGDERLSSQDDYVTLSMWGVPVRRVSVSVSEARMVIPGGHSVGVSDVASEQGAVCPARAADLRAGEAIVGIGGADVNSVDEFVELIEANGGTPVELTISGADGLRTASVTPVLDPHDNCYRLGAWVRDSTAGVGTLSFYDPESQRYGALGHAICDVDTGYNDSCGRRDT